MEYLTCKNYNFNQLFIVYEFYVLEVKWIDIVLAGATKIYCPLLHLVFTNDYLFSKILQRF